MSVLRRHRILADDVRRVIAHLKAHKTITSNDILSRPRLKKKKDAGPTEEIPWARAELAGSESRRTVHSADRARHALCARAEHEFTHLLRLLLRVMYAHAEQHPRALA